MGRNIDAKGRRSHTTVSLRSQTHGILKDLSDQLDKSIVALLHEAALILQDKHGSTAPPHRAADNDAAESPAATKAA